MATVEQPPIEQDSTQHPLRERTVSLVFIAVGSRNREELEAHADMIVEAIETKAAGIALDPAVAWDFPQAEIEVVFTVEARSEAEVHHRLGVILSAIEAELPFGLDRSATEPVRKPRTGSAAEPVCA